MVNSQLGMRQFKESRLRNQSYHSDYHKLSFVSCVPCLICYEQYHEENMSLAKEEIFQTDIIYPDAFLNLHYQIQPFNVKWQIYGEIFF